MGTISKTVLHSLESFLQNQIKLDELMQPGWEDVANDICWGDMKNMTTELKVPAVVKPQIDTTAATPSPKTFGDLMHTLDMVPGLSQIHQLPSGQ
jgi:hypothetical protein